MMISTDSWFVAGDKDPPLIHIPSVRTCFIVQPPNGLCWHATISDTPPRGDEELAHWIEKMPVEGELPRSWHLLITREGRGIQSIPTNKGAWHIGKKWKAIAYGCGDKPVNLNMHLLGVELENVGEVKEKPAGSRLFYRWPYAQKQSLLIEPIKVVEVGGKWYESFTAEQQEFAKMIVAACRLKWGWERKKFEHGHFMYNPNKTDPSPVWMKYCLPKILDDVYRKESEP
jgi:hypothetical protein